MLEKFFPDTLTSVLRLKEALALFAGLGEKQTIYQRLKVLGSEPAPNTGWHVILLGRQSHPSSLHVFCVATGTHGQPEFTKQNDE